MAGLYIHIPFCHSKCAYCDLELFVVNNEISCPHCRYKKKVI